MQETEYAIFHERHGFLDKRRLYAPAMSPPFANHAIQTRLAPVPQGYRLISNMGKGVPSLSRSLRLNTRNPIRS